MKKWSDFNKTERILFVFKILFSAGFILVTLLQALGYSGIPRGLPLLLLGLNALVEFGLSRREQPIMAIVCFLLGFAAVVVAVVYW